MNKYLQKLLYGKREDKVVIETALGVPDTLAVLDAEVNDKPHLAVADGVLYIWNVAAQEWIAYLLVAVEIISLETITDTDYELLDGNMIDMIAMRTDTTATIHVGTTPGGDEIGLVPIELNANQWYTMNRQYVAEGDTTIYFTGFIGPSLIKIYKRKLL